VTRSANIDWVHELREHVERLQALALVQDVGEVLERRTLHSSDERVTEWQLIVDSRTDQGFQWAPVDWRYEKGRWSLYKPSWMMLPGSQHLFLTSPVFETLYAGTRGPGKTLTLLMDFAKDVGQGWGKAWRGILFRRQFGDLDDAVRKIEDWFSHMFPGFRFLKSKSEYMAVWPTGEALLLRHMRNADDYGEYHGHEYPWIGWEELTEWEDDQAYRLMMSCCRPTMPGIPLRVRATTNPYGPGHQWVKRRFRLPDHYEQVIRVPGERERVAIQGQLRENFLLTYADPSYPLTIVQAARNPAQAQAWINGDWNVTSGGMIDDLWDDAVHVLPDIPVERIPRGWKVTRAYDHGQSHPFSVGWFLESNGEPIEIEGTLIGRVRGDRILWREWYGSTGEINTGVRMPARKIGRGIADREEDWGLRDGKRTSVVPGPADTEIFNRSSDREGRCPADDMAEEGVHWERADKSSGSRKRGWEMMRTFLEDAKPEEDGTRERPGFFVCRGCTDWLSLVPPMPRDGDDPDDIPDNYEDHSADMTRYLLNWNLPGMWRKGF